MIVELVRDRERQVLPVAVKRRTKDKDPTWTKCPKCIRHQSSRKEKVLNDFERHYGVVLTRMTLRKRFRQIVLEE